MAVILDIDGQPILDSDGNPILDSYPAGELVAVEAGADAAALSGFVYSGVGDGLHVDVITELTVTATGAGGDITLDNTSINAGQTVTINSAAITHA